MKAKLISAWKIFTTFVKKNAFSCACFLLAALVFVTGTVSYAKYVTSSGGGGGASVAGFTVDATIDGVSALSFTNTDFWGHSATGDQVAMNALHSVNFSVRNYETDDQNKVTSVASTRMKYNLVFSAPVNFTEKLALQVFDEHGAAMLPQIVVSDLISAGDNGTSFNTANSVDYNATACNDLTFKVTKTDGTYVATSGKTTIRLEKYARTVEQSLMFRMWDTSKITTETNPKMDYEGGQLQTPLTATYSQEVDYYRIMIVTDAFVLPAGTATQVKHAIHLAPVGAIDDAYIGSSFVTLQKDTSGKITGFEPISEIYGGTNNIFTLMSVRENVTDNYYANDTYTGSVIKTENDSYNLTELPTQYTNGQTFSTTSSSSQSNVTETYPSGSSHTYEETSYNYATNAVSWSDYAVSSNFTVPTVANHKDSNTTGFVGVARRDTQFDKNNYGTLFYVYKVPVTRTGTITNVTKTVIKKYVNERTFDSKDIVTENTKVIGVDTNGNVQTITMQVERNVETTQSGVETVIETQTTTSTITQTITQTGYIYRAYYVKSGENQLSYFTGDEEELYLLAVDSSGNIINSGESGYAQYHFEDLTQFPTEFFEERLDTAETGKTTDYSRTEKENQSFKEVTTTTEYFTREIVRNYTYAEVTLTDVTWCQRDESGQLVTDDNGNSIAAQYNGDNHLNFFTKENGVDVQKLYLAQCYSKEYPFFVNVVFEQVLE